MSHLSRVKLMATVSSSLTKETMLSKLINYLSIFRINFVDKQFDDYQKRYIDTVLKLDNSKTILLETKGEDSAVQNMEMLTLKKGQKRKIEFSNIKEEGSDTIFVNYSYLSDIPLGTGIVFGEGVSVVVDKNVHGVLTVKVEVGGIIQEGMVIEFLNFQSKLSFLSEKDRQDILRGLQSGVTIVAAGAMKKAEHIIALKDFLRENGGGFVKVFIRFCQPELFAIKEEIIEQCDGVMYTYGDIEAQGHLGGGATSFDFLRFCKLHGKPFVLCVDQSTYDKGSESFYAMLNQCCHLGVDSILFAENFVPEEELQDTLITLSNTIDAYEYNDNDISRFQTVEQRAIREHHIQDYLICDVYRTLFNMPVRVVLCYTNSGQTIAKLSSLRPLVPLIVFTKHDAVYRYVNMMRGVKGYKISQSSCTYAFFKKIGKEMIRILFKGNISLDERIIVLQTNEDDADIDTGAGFLNGMEMYKFKDL